MTFTSVIVAIAAPVPVVIFVVIFALPSFSGATLTGGVLPSCGIGAACWGSGVAAMTRLTLISPPAFRVIFAPTIRFAVCRVIIFIYLFAGEINIG
jgi:hypothetical protein